MACQGFNWWEGGRSAAAGARAIARARAAWGGPRAGRTPTPNPNSSPDARRAEKKKKRGKTPRQKEVRRDANATGLMVRPHSNKYLSFAGQATEKPQRNKRGGKTTCDLMG